jgi:tetratricopeptide (TPR) repeat protein
VAKRKRGARDPDVLECRHALKAAFRTHGYIPYREAESFARGVHKAIDGLEGLLDAARADEVLELCELGMRKVPDAIESMDDSDGHMGHVVLRIEGLHQRAAARCTIESSELAERILRLQLETEYGFEEGIDPYVSRLGDAGMTVYRRLAEAEWDRVPRIGPEDEPPDSRYGERFRITAVMEELARRSGDLEELVEVKARDLSTAYDFLQIAEVYLEAGNHGRALTWAERGVASFPPTRDLRLRDLLAREYLREARGLDAVAVIWDAYEASPVLETYSHMKEIAESEGVWPETRQRALAHLRQAAAGSVSPGGGERDQWEPPANRSELVRVLLWDGDLETALEEARRWGCPQYLWFNLAAALETDFPDAALEIYQAQLPSAFWPRPHNGYEDVIELMRKIKHLLERLGRGAEFADLAGTVRAEHHRKRNLVKLLDAEGW